MVPFWGRFSVRAGRTFLAVLALLWCAVSRSHAGAWAVTGGYMVFALVALLTSKFDIPPRSVVALAGDAAFFALCQWAFPSDAILALSAAFVLISATLMHPLKRLFVAAGVVFICAAVANIAAGLTSGAAGMPAAQGLLLTRTWWTMGAIACAITFGLYKRYLERRMSHTMRHNVMIRSRAETARESERERIAADFHDGPLQNFISFQMRLEIIRKLMTRDASVALGELHQLQELCKNQVAELRGFVRSMRPVDEGISLSASLSRMVEQFQRDTGIEATFSSAEFDDPEQTEVSLELLQIVRETLSNIHRHSGASRVAIQLAKQGAQLEMRAEDNGSGFPFSGAYTLEELEMMRMGPISIKRRVRLLGGELLLNSHPGQGSSLEIRVPL